MAGFRKVIVIGLDGLDPRIAERLMARGALPHLARLRELGGTTGLALAILAGTLALAPPARAQSLPSSGHQVNPVLQRGELLVPTFRLEFGAVICHG